MVRVWAPSEPGPLEGHEDNTLLVTDSAQIPCRCAAGFAACRLGARDVPGKRVAGSAPITLVRDIQLAGAGRYGKRCSRWSPIDGTGFVDVPYAPLTSAPVK